MQEWVRVIWAPWAALWAACVSVVGWVKWGRKKWKAWGRKPTFGESRLAGGDDFKANTGIPVGRVLHKGWLGEKAKLVRMHHESCGLFFGARGSGKTALLGGILRTASGQNFVVQDPSRQLIEQYRQELEAKGYDVKVVDIGDPSRGIGYDVCTYLDGSSPMQRDIDVFELASLLVSDVESGGKVGDHFKRAARICCEGLISWLHVHERHDCGPSRVADILLRMDDADKMTLFHTMRLAGIASTEIAVNMLGKVGSSEGGSITSTLSGVLIPWTRDSMKSLAAVPDKLVWDTALIGAKPCAVFLCGGMLGDETHQHMTRLFFGQCSGTLARLYNVVGALPRKTYMLIDEGSVVGRCMPLVKVIVELRKVGANVLMAFQSPSQLASIYGKETSATITDNSDIVISGGMKTDAYKPYPSLIGHKTANPISKGKGGESVGEQKTLAIHESDLFSMSDDEIFIMLGNKGAIIKKIYKIGPNGLEY